MLLPGAIFELLKITIHQNWFAAGDSRTPLGSLQRSPEVPAGFHVSHRSRGGETTEREVMEGGKVKGRERSPLLFYNLTTDNTFSRPSLDDNSLRSFSLILQYDDNNKSIMRSVTKLSG